MTLPLLAILIVGAVLPTSLPAQVTPPADGGAEGQSLPDPTDLEADLPFRPEIRSGRLENGLAFYALEHPHPEDTVVIRLVVDAGSILETDSQAGLAHFVEHMAFNGTEKYGETELVAYLESLGIRFGPDVNASTGFDETIYKLELPADDPDALATGFDVMRQWAGEITFAPEAIDRERGVITEEWRGSRGASMRILETHIPVLLQDSRYAERLPIGELEVIQNAPRREFVDFYRRWYRPDNMAMIAVGDLPADRLERLIRETMDDLPRPATNLDRPYYFVPEQGGIRVSVATDTEASRSTVSLYALHPPYPAQTIGDYRDLLVRALFVSVINERVRDAARAPDAPITAGGAGFTRFLRGTEIAVSSAVVRNDRVLEAFRFLATEMERARRHGVLEDELDRARRRLLQGIDDARTNFGSRPAASLADELVRHWTEGESVPGIEFEARMYEALLPGITADEVSGVAEAFAPENDLVLLASLQIDADQTLPSGASVPDERDFRRVLSSVRSVAIDPPQSTDDGATLLRAVPQPGEVTAQEVHQEVDVTEYRLSNGMRVFVKQTDFSEDEVRFSAYSPGGLALVPDRLVPAARITATVAGESGLGGLDAAGLDRALSGTSVAFSASIGRVSEGMSGSARSGDLDLLFQMIHAAFVDPRLEETALENVRQQTLQQIRGSLASPQGRYSRRLQELFAGGDRRLEPLAADEVEAVRLADIETVYRDRIADPADFVMVFVGSVAPERIADLAARYLASIPASVDGGTQTGAAGFRESVPTDRYPRPEGTIAETLAAGQEPLGQLVMVFHGPYEWSQRENHRLNSLASYLDIRLREEIREDAGGAYSIGAGAWRWRAPEPWAYLQVAFGLDPARADELRGRALDIVRDAAVNPPSSDYLDRVQAQQRDSYEQQIRENDYWVSAITFSARHGRDPAQILAYPDLVESLTAEDIRETARRYIDPARRIELLLVPAADE